ncbi:MAG: hypothetical protein DSZ30_02300, partial [Aquificaceae bacterium]
MFGIFIHTKIPCVEILSLKIAETIDRVSQTYVDKNSTFCGQRKFPQIIFGSLLRLKFLKVELLEELIENRKRFSKLVV